MSPDDEICYCYHVPLRKLVRYARRIRPARPSLMSECLGAGTGCGWCIPFLKKIAAEAPAADPDAAADALSLTPDEYARERQIYIKTHQPKHRF